MDIRSRFAAALLGALLLAACSPPERSAWPRARILLDAPSRGLIGERDLREFARQDGSILDLDVRTPEQIRALIDKGTDADLVIVSDDALWRDLERGKRLAGDPWRFKSHRQRVLIVVPAAGSGSSPREVVAVSPESAAGRIAQSALKLAKIWKSDPVSLTHPANIVQVADEPAALEAALTGKARSAAVLSDFEAAMGPQWRVERRLDPYPDWPDMVASGVLARSGRPELAHRAWCFLERIVRPEEYGYTAERDKK